MYAHLTAWVASGTVLEDLRNARPELPAVHDDRKVDVLEPLLAIADAAGGDWPAAARKAAAALAGSAQDHDTTVELLADIADILDGRREGAVLPTKDLIAQLVALEDRPWASWGKSQRPITGRALAWLLGPLDIHPVTTKLVRGYRWDAFDDAIARYLPIKASTVPTQ